MKPNLHGRFSLVACLAITSLLTLAAGAPYNGLKAQTSLKVAFTTDIHGSILGWNFVANTPVNGGLPSLYSYLKTLSGDERKNLLLLDGGDILQGQTSVTFYNHHPQYRPHLAAKAMNFIGYDAAVVGNHDVEAGHQTYDQIVDDFHFPWLAANILDAKTRKPYFKPYTIVQKNGLKIAVLGLSTPGVPSWLPKKLWKGLYFDDMLESAARWMDTIRNKEHPDLIVGIFHAGFHSDQNRYEQKEKINFDPVEDIARFVPGFDLILYGHDHQRRQTQVVNILQQTVALANPGPKGLAVCEIKIDTATHIKDVKTEVYDLTNFPRAADFVAQFEKEHEIIENYVKTPVFFLETPIYAEEALWGPSTFVDVLHTIQLDLSAADISLCAPFRSDVKLDSGMCYVRNLYDLYYFENYLTILSLSGDEVRRILEYSADLWIQTMRRPGDSLFQMVRDERGVIRMPNPIYNIDMAAGIRYTIDVSKPKGTRIQIFSMDDAKKSPFNPRKYYKVVTNSYRSSGGGGHLKAIGFTDSIMESRLLYESDMLMREELQQWLQSHAIIRPRLLNNWKMIPEDWVKPAVEKFSKHLHKIDTVSLTFVEMTDLHGNFFDWDFIRQRPALGGLPFIYSYVQEERSKNPESLILLNGGDLLQGQLSSYYYNYVDPRPPYMPSVMMNKLRVDASVIGNHDIEQGRFTLERYSQGLRSPIVTANLIDNETGKPYFEPYWCFYREGVKIAILGLTIPLVTNCQYANPGDRFSIQDMLPAAQYWVPKIREKEKPDILIGLIHGSYKDEDTINSCQWVNSARAIAREVPGFDALFLGHEHKLVLERERNANGDSVWLIEPGYGGRQLGVLTIDVTKTIRKNTIIGSQAKIENVANLIPPPDIQEFLRREKQIITRMAEDTVTILLDTINNIDAFFGPSAFVDLIHDVQLAAMDAEISFASPLSTNVVIPPGPVLFSDLFRLYRYENTLVAFKMQGEEIRNYLEYAYDFWIQTMTGPKDPLLRLSQKTGGYSAANFEIPQYYFDSAKGIFYSVDVSQPFGQRVVIQTMANGQAFDLQKWYRVVCTEHRFQGHGGHFRLGAKIEANKMEERVIEHNSVQVREHLRQYMLRNTPLRAVRAPHWRFVPESWANAAAKRERSLFMGL